MIFGKKSHKLNIGRLAEAICLYSDKINLPDLMTLAKNGKVFHVTDNVRFGQHLTLNVSDLYYSTPTKYFVMKLNIHLDGINLAEYQLILDTNEKQSLFNRFLREWDCYEANIIHTIPNQFVDPINNWSSKITKYAHDIVEQAQREKEAAEREKYNKEEAIIQMYR